jgi:hypothetical protein
MLVSVGLLQPLFPLFFKDFITTVSITMRWPEFSAHWEISIYHYTILEKYV